MTTTAIQFYHLTATPLERALPRLLEKAYAGGFRTLVATDSDEQAERLNELLWTYDPGSFLPHGSLKDGQAERQPILLSTCMEPVNGANVLAVVSGVLPPQPEAFERILDIFNGNDPQAVDKARQRWSAYKQAGSDLSYFRQTETGGWEKKSV